MSATSFRFVHALSRCIIFATLFLVLFRHTYLFPSIYLMHLSLYAFSFHLLHLGAVSFRNLLFFSTLPGFIFRHMRVVYCAGNEEDFLLFRIIADLAPLRTAWQYPRLHRMFSFFGQTEQVVPLGCRCISCVSFHDAVAANECFVSLRLLDIGMKMYVSKIANPRVIGATVSFLKA